MSGESSPLRSDKVYASAAVRRTLARGPDIQPGVVMRGFVRDIEELAGENEHFRSVLYTAEHCQLVVMSLKPSEDIGEEVHELDQFFRVEEGIGTAVLDGVRTAIRAGFAILVPAGTLHNIINTGALPLKLYTLYSPPHHRDGVVHHARADAEEDSERFDGTTTEGRIVATPAAQGDGRRLDP